MLFSAAIPPFAFASSQEKAAKIDQGHNPNLQRFKVRGDSRLQTKNPEEYAPPPLITETVPGLVVRLAGSNKRSNDLLQEYRTRIGNLQRSLKDESSQKSVLESVKTTGTFRAGVIFLKIRHWADNILLLFSGQRLLSLKDWERDVMGISSKDSLVLWIQENFSPYFELSPNLLLLVVPRSVRVWAAKMHRRNPNLWRERFERYESVHQLTWDQIKEKKLVRFLLVLPVMLVSPALVHQLGFPAANVLLLAGAVFMIPIILTAARIDITTHKLDNQLNPLAARTFGTLDEDWVEGLRAVRNWKEEDQNHFLEMLSSIGYFRESISRLFVDHNPVVAAIIAVTAIEKGVGGIKDTDVKTWIEECVRQGRLDSAGEIALAAAVKGIEGIGHTDVKRVIDQCLEERRYHNAKNIMIVAIENGIQGIDYKDARTWINVLLKKEQHDLAGEIAVKVMEKWIAEMDQKDVKTWIDSCLREDKLDAAEEIIVTAIGKGMRKINHTMMKRFIKKSFRKERPDLAGRMAVLAMEKGMKGIGHRFFKRAFEACLVVRPDLAGEIAVLAIGKGIKGVVSTDVNRAIEKCFKIGRPDLAGEIAISAIEKGIDGIHPSVVKRAIKECMKNWPDRAGFLALSAIEKGIKGIDFTVVKRAVDKCLDKPRKDEAGFLVLSAIESRMDGIDHTVVKTWVDEFFRKMRPDLAGKIAVKAIESGIEGIDRADLKRAVDGCFKVNWHNEGGDIAAAAIRMGTQEIDHTVVKTWMAKCFKERWLGAAKEIAVAAIEGGIEGIDRADVKSWLDTCLGRVKDWYGAAGLIAAARYSKLRTLHPHHEDIDFTIEQSVQILEGNDLEPLLVRSDVLRGIIYSGRDEFERVLRERDAVLSEPFFPAPSRSGDTVVPSDDEEEYSFYGSAVSWLPIINSLYLLLKTQGKVLDQLIESLENLNKEDVISSEDLESVIQGLKSVSSAQELDNLLRPFRRRYEVVGLILERVGIHVVKHIKNEKYKRIIEEVKTNLGMDMDVEIVEGMPIGANPSDFNKFVAWTVDRNGRLKVFIHEMDLERVEPGYFDPVPLEKVLAARLIHEYLEYLGMEHKKVSEWFSEENLEDLYRIGFEGIRERYEQVKAQHLASGEYILKNKVYQKLNEWWNENQNVACAVAVPTPLLSTVVPLVQKMREEGKYIEIAGLTDQKKMPLSETELKRMLGISMDVLDLTYNGEKFSLKEFEQRYAWRFKGKRLLVVEMGDEAGNSGIWSDVESVRDLGLEIMNIQFKLGSKALEQIRKILDSINQGTWDSRFVLERLSQGSDPLERLEEIARSNHAVKLVNVMQ